MFKHRIHGKLMIGIHNGLNPKTKFGLARLVAARTIGKADYYFRRVTLALFMTTAETQWNKLWTEYPLSI